MINSVHRLDLNLLTTLDALLVELNVTRAARRLHLSQPAVSVQLARLREYFDDPLLLPGPRGMRPTARANELREPLRHALALLTHAEKWCRVLFLELTTSWLDLEETRSARFAAQIADHSKSSPSVAHHRARDGEP